MRCRFSNEYEDSRLFENRAESYRWEGTSLYRRGFDREKIAKSFNCIHLFLNDYRIGKYVLDQ